MKNVMKFICYKKYFLSILVLFVSLGVSFAFFTVKDSLAQSAAGFNIEVSPAKVNQMIAPGTSYTQTYRVGNYSGSDQTIYIYANDFTVKDEEGTLQFYEGESNESSDEYALSEWITIETSELFVPDANVSEVDVTVNVPEDAEAGGHYAAIFFQTQDPAAVEDGSSVSAIGRIASLLLATVPGDVDEALTVVDFYTDKSIYWNSNPQVELISHLQNNGTVHMIPSGLIFMNGGLNVDNKNVQYNTKQIVVMPDVPPRKISEIAQITSSGFIPPIGKMTPDLQGVYGITDAQTFEAATSFWVIPIKFIVVVGLLTLLALFIIWRVILSFKKEKPQKTPEKDSK